MSGFTPTDEQLSALDAYRTGQNLVIEAVAGAGKTSTLCLLAESTPHLRGQFCAFNKMIVEDVKRVAPPNVNCSTAHSLAFRGLGYRFKDRLDSPRMRSSEIARRLRVQALGLHTESGTKVLGEDYLAGLVMRSVLLFCQSADPEPDVRHVPYIDGLDMPDTNGNRTYANNRRLARHLLPYIVTAWEDLQRTDGSLKFDHAHYLKLYELSRPHIGVDVIYLDEAQDLSDVLISLFGQQEHAQRVYVGDQNQEIYCQPVGTLVSVPDEPVEYAPDRQCSFTYCDRLRANRASGLCQWHEQQARKGLALSERPRRGKRSSTKTVPIESLRIGDVVVTYHNAHVYKMGREITAIRRRRHTGQLIRIQLSNGMQSAYTPEHHCVVRMGHHLHGKHVVYLMRRGDHFRIGRTPILYRTQNNSFGLGLRATAEKADAAWILSVHDDVPSVALAEALAQARYGIPGMRFVSSPKDVVDLAAYWRGLDSMVEAATKCLEDHGRLIDHPLWTSGQENPVGLSRPFVTVAANLIDGFMALPLGAESRYRGKTVYHASRDVWVPFSVTREDYDGDVISMEVADHHTYYADGVLTHNSYLGCHSALGRLGDARRAVLSQSFRFGPDIADIANLVLSFLPTDMVVRGTPTIPSTVGALPSPHAILTRTNAMAITVLMRALDNGRTPHMVGGTDQVSSFCHGVSELKETGRTSHPELACFDSWMAVREYVEHDAQGEELKLMVNLIDRFGERAIIFALKRMPSEDRADLVISTGHRSKGRAWPTVQLASDFPAEALKMTTEGLKLLYVAATRARQGLDIDGVGWFRDAEVAERQTVLRTAPTAMLTEAVPA